MSINSGVLVFNEDLRGSCEASVWRAASERNPEIYATKIEGGSSCAGRYDQVMAEYTELRRQAASGEGVICYSTGAAATQMRLGDTFHHRIGIMLAVVFSFSFAAR